MSQVNKPVILDETGQLANQQIEAIGPIIDASKDALFQKLTELGEKIDELGERLPTIIEAMDRLDIIYYVEKDE